MPGEVVGIIGRNGAGKSTLLKILSRVTEPTLGRVELYGRVGSLLEVGTGFHPELTGRENVYLNGAILGMRREEIARKFDEIVEFAELTKFIDTPVKHYSSGMYTRLAFAVAAHLEPEILIVDEVLAVGDEAFQRKCLGKMDDVTRQGRTVLLVTHQLGMVSQLCAHAILLERGKIQSIGRSTNVVKVYLSSAPDLSAGGLLYAAKGSNSRPAQILRCASARLSGEEVNSFSHDEPVTIKIDFVVRQPMPLLSLGVSLLDHTKRMVFSSSIKCPTNVQGYTATMTIPKDIILPGSFSFALQLHHPTVESIEEVKDTGSIRIIDPAGKFAEHGELHHGVVFVDCKWSLESNKSDGVAR
jgi:lipopolysaccharide transport system ATP-binding protein